MEKLKRLKEMLMDGIASETGKGLQNINKEELGEAIDMIKDIEEIIYYCAITEAMDEKKEEEKFMQRQYSSMYPMTYNYSNGSGNGSRNYDGEGRMYYNGNGGGISQYASNGGNDARGGGSRGYSDGWVMAPFDARDFREGRSYVSRRNYMEGKEMHHDKAKQMQELDKYVEELTSDVLEMIHDASPEEKMALSQKMNTLANKIK